MTAHYLPAANIKDKVDVADILTLSPLRRITEGLRRGQGYDLTVLRPLAHQCRALADAYDHRMRLAAMEDEVTDHD